jgi:predicted site-specific integrase-resolvase
MSEFVNASQAARELGISRATLDTIIRRGDLEDYASRVNRKVRLLKAEDVRRLKEGAIVRRSAEARPQVAVA